MGPLRIIEDDLSSAAIAAFPALHLAEMQQSSPPGTVHALPGERLRQPDVTFFTECPPFAGYVGDCFSICPTRRL